MDLYFQKFEFNASIYYLLRELLFSITGYNQIFILGPALALITVVLILRRVLKTLKADFLELVELCLYSFVAYLLLATTVHPWYLLVPIALCVFVRKWYVILWSLFIYLSYSTYNNHDFNQNLLLIGLEYGLVLVVWYLERKTTFIKSPNKSNI